MRRRSVSSLVSPGAAGADAAAELAHGLALAGEAGELVFELRELNLELTLAGAGVASEDIEDKLSTIDDAAGQAGFEVAHLRGGKVVVEEDEVGFGGEGDGFDLLDLAGAYEGGGVGAGAALQEGGDDLRAGGASQLLELGERGFEVEIGRGRGLGVSFVFGESACEDCGGFLGQTRRRSQLATLTGKLHSNEDRALGAR